ncbi:MAG: SDR family oxidoreductase [Burkholderiales bacterium]|nr:SDR family oxidoreductase [Burkholderiales bacterium]
MRAVFITGASGGIGAALARHYAARGAVVGLIARRAEGIAALAGELGGTVWTGAGDVADAAFMRRAADAFMQAHGVPDLVVANAGISIGTLGAAAEDLAVLERILRTNVLGLAATVQPFVEPMRARRAGTLAGIASVAGFRGLPGSGAYSASKAAAITWLESLRAELAGSGVRVVTVCPGYIDTPMTRVNRYRMPFLLSAGEGARRIARAIDGGRTFAVVPWQMAIASLVLRGMPNWLYDRLAARAPRKPRVGDG